MRIGRWLLSPTVAPFYCLALLFAGLIVDINTDPALVVAIIYNIPIAISAAVLSRTLTSWTIVLSLGANLAAGWVNAVAAGGFDGFVVLNRSAAAVTFLIVGAMTLLFETRSQDVRELHEVEDASERATAVRALMVALTRPSDDHELLAAAAVELRRAMRADAVVISALDGDRFAEPRWASPENTKVASPGKLASWAVEALPVTASPVITVRSDDGATTVGRIDRDSDREALVVVVRRPGSAEPSRLLSDALPMLASLRERAIEFGRLRAAAGEAVAAPTALPTE